MLQRLKIEKSLICCFQTHEEVKAVSPDATATPPAYIHEYCLQWKHKVDLGFRYM